MKNKLFNSVKIGLLMLGTLLVSGYVHAVGTYTAVVSGNWSSTTTWGGSAPPFNLSTGDQVTVSTGITVTMDSTVTINGVLAQISVAGTLSSNNSMFLYVTTGTLTGAGTINVGNVVLNTGSTFSFTGSLASQTFVNSIASLTSTANITVNNTLSLMGGILSVQTGGVLNVSSNSTIVVSGAQLDVSGGTLNLSSSYNVNYISTSATTGMELSGTGLKSVNINVGAANTVTLGANLTMNDSLKLTSGALALGGNTLTINGAVTGIGSLTGDAAANILINTSGGISSSLAFAAAGQMLNNLTINVGGSNSVVLASPLSIEGTLSLSGGSNLNINGESLTLDGTLSGSGALVVNSGSGLTINTAGSIATPIILSGVSIGNFDLNVGNSNTVTLGSNLTVGGKLTLQSGTLVLNNNNLSVSGDIAASGSGNLFSTANSNVTISSTTSPSGSLAFSYPGNIVNNFNVAIGGTGAVTIGSDVVVQGALNFTAGLINTGSYNLQIAASGSIAGANSNSYVITGANGELTMNATTSASTNLPVGTAAYYFPASITLNPSSSTGTVGVNVSSGVYAQGTSGVEISNNQPLVNATWLFETNISSNLNYNMQLTWSPAVEVNGFIHTNDYISHYTGSDWDVSAYTNATMVGGGMFSVQRNSLTSMSPFSVFDASTVPTGINEIADNSQFQIYPNPANDNIYVRNNWNTASPIYADVVNVCGQVVSTFQIENSSTTSIPLTGLAGGVYFLRLYNNTMSVVKKFIKVE